MRRRGAPDPSLGPKPRAGPVKAAYALRFFLGGGVVVSLAVVFELLLVLRLDELAGGDGEV